MDLGFSGGKACGGFPSCLLTGAERKPGQKCEAPPTGGLLLMRFLSGAIAFYCSCSVLMMSNAALLHLIIPFALTISCQDIILDIVRHKKSNGKEVM